MQTLQIKPFYWEALFHWGISLYERANEVEEKEIQVDLLTSALLAFQNAPEDLAKMAINFYYQGLCLLKLAALNQDSYVKRTQTRTSLSSTRKRHSAFSTPNEFFLGVINHTSEQLIEASISRFQPALSVESGHCLYLLGWAESMFFLAKLRESKGIAYKDLFYSIKTIMNPYLKQR